MRLLQEFVSISKDFVLEYWTLFLGITFIVYLVSYSFFLAKRWWLMHIHNKTLKGWEWVVLELKFPKENLKSPQAMEQVFASMEGYYSFGFNFKFKWIVGEIEKWTSFEIVGNAGAVKFYARVNKKLRKLLENALFAQYPEIEIKEVPDYFDSLPKELPNDKYEVWGADLILAKENAYPIRTYETYDSPEEEQRLDPISMITEVMANLKDDEWMMLHIVFRPSGTEFFPNWKKEGEAIIDKFAGRKPPSKGPALLEIFYTFLKNLIKAWATPPEWGEAKEEKAGSFRISTPGEQEVMKAIDRKMSKIPFEAIVRWLYIDSKEAVTTSNIFNLMGSVKQWDTKNLNSLRPSGGTFTYITKVGLFAWDTTNFFKKYINKADIFFRPQRLFKRRRKVYQLFRERYMPSNTQPMTYHKLGHLHIKSYILNAEELATIFHPPGIPVGAQKLGQIHAKKGGPPESLPMIE